MEIFDYDNVLLLPRKCRVESRRECDPSAGVRPRRFALPVVPANMKTVVDEPIAEWLAANGFFYVMHRFDVDNVAYAKSDARQGPVRLDQLGRQAARLRGDRPRWRAKASAPTTSRSTSPTATPTPCTG